jgi:CRISPR-associated endonuclease/helicase Cas3
MDSRDRHAARVAAQASGYPGGYRHESLSAFLAARLLAAADDNTLDVELVVHLIASHHGHSRPLLPAIHDPNPPTTVTLDSGETISVAEHSTVDETSPARFDRLRRRYGPWRLALWRRSCALPTSPVPQATTRRRGESDHTVATRWVYSPPRTTSAMLRNRSSDGDKAGDQSARTSSGA